MTDNIDLSENWVHSFSHHNKEYLIVCSNNEEKNIENYKYSVHEIDQDTGEPTNQIAAFESKTFPHTFDKDDNIRSNEDDFKTLQAEAIVEIIKVN